MEKVGERLKLALNARGFRKQMAFAAALEVDESAVSRWQRGSGLSLANAMRICTVLDISLDWLLLGRGTMDLHRSRPGRQQGGHPDLYPYERSGRNSGGNSSRNPDERDDITVGLSDAVIDALVDLTDAIRATSRPDR